MKIAVAGLGYVGLSKAALLSQNHDVVAVDIDAKRVSDGLCVWDSIPHKEIRDLTPVW